MAQDETDNLPPPPEDLTFTTPDACRVWIGNLDLRINEFTLLKLLQKHGSLKNYDFLYHKSGPDKGKPRGYCFATYSSSEEAEMAILKLNGKMALSRRLVVKPAYAPPEGDTKGKPADRKQDDHKQSTSNTADTIAAIEAKLQDIDAGMGTSHIIADEYIKQAKKLPEKKTYKERPHRPYQRHKPPARNRRGR